ncbi:MAG: hypothetical protein JKY88_09070 [Pseudomonadales bacterium]|nr:hypothetical protein [Pseudomonadales bacterium]
MASPYKRKRRRAPTALPISVPAPMGGWNTRDGLDMMPPEDAVLLDNWIPGTSDVAVRSGYASHATGMGSGNVDTLAEYHTGTTRNLIACANGNIYDATGAPSSLGSGFSSNQWQVANFNGSLFLVNGTDAPQDYDGTTLSATAWTGSGLTISDLVGLNVFKTRLYFWEEDSQDFWYAAPAGVTGTLTKFPLSRVGNFGGNLITMGTWTHDGGSGVDDHAVFIMSSGDVIVYQGSDPGDAADWSLVGVYRIGVPLGVRGVAKVGGDLMIMTTDDYVSLSQVLVTGQLGSASKLSGAVVAASDNSSLFGWQVIIDRKKELLLFNVPVSATEFDQHVINVLTGAAGRLKDIPARCWTSFNGDLYFGSTDGAIYKMTGSTDAGASVNADGRASWTSFGTPTRKRVTAARPILSSTGLVDYAFGIGSDFADALTPAPATVTPVSSPWDISPWDTSPWSAEFVVGVGWIVASANGQTISPRLKISTKEPVSWLRTDYRIESGTNL